MSTLETIGARDFIRRLFDRDASLWSDEPARQELIRERLGWLRSHETMAERSDEFVKLAGEVAERGYRQLVLLGMGGSSLAPEVFQNVFGAGPGRPPLAVLDTTDPAAILALERSIDLPRTMFIVSSKSGTTIETTMLYRYFAAKCGGAGQDVRLDNFIAITDPGTPLEDQARRAGFAHVFLNPPDIGGRYSALSCFGLVPAAAIGVDIPRLLDRTAGLDPAAGLELGAALAGHWRDGRDKVTFLAPRHLDRPSEALGAAFGAWAEQLLAESLGKDGRGIVPVHGEATGPPRVYGRDRVFVRLRPPEGDAALDAPVTALEEAGQPVITFTLRDPYDLGAEFLRWEIATAAAGAAMRVNPFDEPNVAESKENTRRVLEEAARAGRVPEPPPAAVEGGLRLYYDGNTASRLGLDGRNVLGTLAGVLAGREGDYLALQAYIQPSPAHDLLLREIRILIRDATHLATTAGYGPRFLHSTGQLHKGGPDTGIFLQITCDDGEEVAIPGETAYGFSAVKRAQALGDFAALQRRGRRAVRVHLGADVSGGLRRLFDGLRAAVPARAAGGR